MLIFACLLLIHCHLRAILPDAFTVIAYLSRRHVAGLRHYADIFQIRHFMPPCLSAADYTRFACRCRHVYA